jgi:hypothetical protein
MELPRPYQVKVARFAAFQELRCYTRQSPSVYGMMII